MKFRITLKDPDGIYDCIADAVDENRPDDLGAGEWESLRGERIANLTHSRFIDHGDYVEIEIDTDADTAIVIGTDA